MPVQSTSSPALPKTERVETFAGINDVIGSCTEDGIDFVVFEAVFFAEDIAGSITEEVKDGGGDTESRE